MKKYLIIQTAFTGDVIIATAMIEALHGHDRSAQIDIMVRKGNEYLFAGHPFLGKVRIWDKKRKYSSMYENVRSIRNERYDETFIVQRFLNAGLMAVLSKSRSVSGFKKNPMSIFFSRRVPHVIGDGRHETERNHLLIQHITGPIPAKPALYPLVDDINQVSRHQSEPYVCIAPSSVWFTKMYPIEKWVELVDSIQALRIFLIGAPSEHGVCEAIISSCSNKNVLNLCGSMSLLQSAALMKDAVMNFTNDSAPCHLAGALNAPVTAIFCSTLPEFGFTPVSDRSAVVQTSRKLPCRPCGLHGKKKCPEKHFACGHTIDTRALLEHIPIQYRKKIE